MKRTAAVLLILILIIPAIPIMPVMADRSAIWVDFSNNKEMQNFSHVTFASATTAVDTVNAVTIDGVECWQMEEGGNREYIRFNIDNSYISAVKDGTEYIVSVEYYDGDVDNENQGFFSLEYDAIDRKCKVGGMVVLENSGQWKTAEFCLDDAYFGTRLMNRSADFRLTIVPQKSAGYEVSPVPVAIKKVYVAPSGIKRNIRVVSSTAEYGNAFAWDSGSKVVTNTLKNITANDITANVTFKAMLNGNKTMFCASKIITIPANGEITEDVAVPLTRCGVYDWVVDVEQDDGIKYHKDCTKFAIIKTDKDGIKNNQAYVAHHLNRYFSSGGDNREITEGIALIARSNAVGIRAEASWGELKTSAEAELSFENTSAQLINRLAAEHNLKTTWLLAGGCYAVTGGWDSYPDTAEELSAYKEYVSLVARNVNNTAASFEVAHEIDNVNFNPIIDFSTEETDATPMEYGTLIKETASALADENIEKPLIAYGLVNLSDETVNKWLEPAIENGAFDVLDTFSYHPYTQTFCPERAWNLWYFAPKIKEKIKSAKPEISMAITELGTSITTKSYVDGKRSRGASLCRGAIAYIARGVSDFVTHYVFEDKGQLGEISYEDGFGMVDFSTEALRDDSDAIFIPNDTFLSFTGMNYVLGNSEPWTVFELDEDVSATGFLNQKFDAKVVVLNTIGASEFADIDGAFDITKEVTVNLGTNNIRCFDDFGNEIALTSPNGSYTFMLNERPVYLVGDIADVRLEPQGKFGVNVGSVKFDKLDLDMTVCADPSQKYTGRILFPDCVETEAEFEIINGYADIPLKLNSKLPQKSVAEVIISDNEGRNYFFGQINVEQIAELEFPGDLPFGVKSVIVDNKIADEKATVTTLGAEDFSDYDMAYNPELNKGSTNDYAETSQGRWSRQYHTKEVSWWGQGSYVNDYGQLSIDSYSNTNPTTIAAIRKVREDGAAVKEKILDISFDMAYYVVERHEGSSFTLYADETPIFNVSRSEVNLYSNQKTDRKLFVYNNTFERDNYGRDLIGVHLSFDFEKKKVRMRYKNVIRETGMCEDLIKNGISTIRFAVNLFNGIETGNGDYRGNAFVMDNYIERSRNVSAPAAYRELIDKEDKPAPTFATVNIVFNRRIDPKTFGDIAMNDSNGSNAVRTYFLSEDGRTLKLEASLAKETEYTLLVPTTVKSAAGVQMGEEYQEFFTTDAMIRFTNENGEKLTEQELEQTSSVNIELLAGASAKASAYACVVAIFDKKDDVLKNLITKEFSCSDDEILSDEQSLQLNNGEYAKVFLWDGYNKIKPLERCFVIGKKK